MGSQKQTARNINRRLSLKVILAMVIAVFILILGSGIAYPHIVMYSYYKDFTNPQPAWCTVCHKTPTSHDDKWMTNHGAAAIFERGSCTPCHKTPYCKDCHKKKPASHASNWIPTHIGKARTDGVGCYECHPASHCDKCHDAVKR